MRNHRFCILCAILAGLLALILFSTPAAAADTPVSFIADVAPIFKENCFACHDARKKAGKYDMTTFEKLLAGAADGAAITPGKPDSSDAYTLMVTDDTRRMPPRDKGAAVPKAKADVIRRWIAEGAKLDAGLDAKADIVAELRRRWTPPVPPKAYPRPVVINALTFTPDSKRLVVGGYHELTTWDLQGALQSRLNLRSERVYALAYLKDGRLALVGGRPGQEGEVRIVTPDAPTSLPVQPLWDGDDVALCLAVSADGTRLAAGGTDRLVRVWNVSDKSKPVLEQTIDNHADWVLGASFTADGKFLYTAGRDRTAKVWDFAKKESILTMGEHQAIVYGVAAKADGTLGFSVGADKLLRPWKPNAEAKPLKASAGHGDEILKLAVHPTTGILFTAGADKLVKSWEPTDKVPPLKTYGGAKDVLYALAVSSDGKLLAAGGYDGEVIVWNVEDAKIVSRFVASPGYKP